MKAEQANQLAKDLKRVAKKHGIGSYVFTYAPEGTLNADIAGEIPDVNVGVFLLEAGKIKLISLSQAPAGGQGNGN